MSLLLSLLKKNETILSTYVNLGYSLLKTVTQPMESLLNHLLVVQNIDPETKVVDPLKKDLFTIFNKLDSESYDTDYNNWSHSKFLELRKKVPFINITEDQFKSATDISKLYDKSAELKVVNKKSPTKVKAGKAKVTTKKNKAKPTFFLKNPIKQNKKITVKRVKQ